MNTKLVNPNDQSRSDKLVTCPVCNGDGKETCTNPDHGLIGALNFNEIGRLGCPCCGHDPKHKVPNGGACEVCNGFGAINSTYVGAVIIDYES